MKTLFRLSSSLLDALDINDLAATVNAMIECNIFHPPFEQFTIEAPMKCCLRFYDSEKKEERGPPPDLEQSPVLYHINKFSMDKDAIDVRVECVALGIRDGLETVIEESYKTKVGIDEIKLFQRSAKRAAFRLVSALIVLLATRNIEKRVSENKLAKFGIKSKKKGNAERTITLHIGKPIVEKGDPGLTGRKMTVAMMRRGHSKRQHYGPRNELVKQIFVQPYWTHADEGYLERKRTYNVIGD